MNDLSKTEQLNFWNGDFGTGYIDRNSATSKYLRARVQMWAQIMKTMEGEPPTSILEVGSNIGNNLRALKALTVAEMFALEPNNEARGILIQDGVVPEDNAMEGFAANIPMDEGSVELSFTSGVLIHISPDHLLESMKEIHRVSSKYIVCVEYFSAKPEMIPYHGEVDRLFKRDFGCYYLDNFPDLRVLNYGFAWKKLTGIDDMTWWVFEKQA